MKEYIFSVNKKDFTVQTFRSGGKGGQHQNKTESGVRIIHRESGARGESREERSQHKNKMIAFKRLASSEKFQSWIRVKASEILTKETIEDKVDKWMHEDSLKIEYI